MTTLTNCYTIHLLKFNERFRSAYSKGKYIYWKFTDGEK